MIIDRREAESVRDHRRFNSYLVPLSASESVAIPDKTGEARYVGMAPADEGYLPGKVNYDHMENTLLRDHGIDAPDESDRWQKELQSCIRAIAAWTSNPQPQSIT